MLSLGLPELLIILAIGVLLFGTRRLQELGSGLGKAIRGFKGALAGTDAIDVTPKPKPGEAKRSGDGKA